MFIPIAYAPLRKIIRDNLQTRKSIRLLLPAFTPSEDASDPTSRNLDWLTSELRNWDYNLLQSLTIFLPWLFPQKCLLLNNLMQILSPYKPNFGNPSASIPPEMKHKF